MKENLEVEGMEGLKVIESSIVPIYEDSEARILVNARDLHTFLESKQEFSPWIKHRLGKYGFMPNEDYLITLSNRAGDTTGKPRTDYLLFLNTAREIAMLESNEKGKMIRKYFIECERRLRTAGDGIKAETARKQQQQEKWFVIRELNARSRQAQILKSTAEFFKAILSDGAMKVIVNEIMMLITGKCLIAPPVIETLYSAAEIGRMCGVSSTVIECIADALGLKTDEYGMLTMSKGLDGSNQAIFQYKLKAADAIKELLDAARTTPVEEVSLEEEFDLSGIYL
jgi:phage anti-repressor protein